MEEAERSEFEGGGGWSSLGVGFKGKEGHIEIRGLYPPPSQVLTRAASGNGSKVGRAMAPPMSDMKMNAIRSGIVVLGALAFGYLSLQIGFKPYLENAQQHALQQQSDPPPPSQESAFPHSDS